MVETIVIVGGGECGARAATVLREEGWDGRITIVGAEPLAPYERPPLSKSALTSLEQPCPTTILDEHTMTAAGIDFHGATRATEIDRSAHHVVLADGRRLRYDRLLLATGAVARPLPIEDDAGVLYLRTYADAVALRERLWPGARVGIIGGGFIGLELAASASARGCQVSVIEVAERVLARVVPAPVAAIVAARHADAGVAVRYGVTVDRLVRNGEKWRLELADGDITEHDTIIAGVGALPDIALADSAGLETDNGVKVDELFLTSGTDIFAAGDCCSFPHPLFEGRRIRLEAWRNAQDQGAAAALSMLGRGQPYRKVPWFWSDQYELTLQIVGLPHAADMEVVRTRDDGVEIRFGLAVDGRLLAASAIGKGNAVAKDIRVGEMLIAEEAHPDPGALTDPAVNLKTLLTREPARAI